MGISGSLTLGIAAVGLIVALVVAHRERSRALDAIQRRLEGRQPPEPRSEYGRGNLRIVRNGPPGWQRLPCDMDGWDDPKGAA